MSEPMGFVVERWCPFVPSAPWPDGSKVEVYVVPEDRISPDWALCDKAKYRVVGHHGGPRLTHWHDRDNVGVCEHMGHLVE